MNWVGVTDMVYTRRNLLASANANGTAVSYAYDGEGRRIQKTVNGATQTFYYEGDRLAAWKNGNDTYYFLYDNTGICGFYRNAQCYLFLKNMLGDVLALYLVSGTAATLVARYEYDAWGVCTVKNPDGTLNVSANFMGNINPFRYRGYFYDTELGLYWLKTRHYDPRVGRFLTKDSMDYYNHTAIDGLNLYAYCLNNPVNHMDPWGNFSWRFTTLPYFWAKNYSFAFEEIIQGTREKMSDVVDNIKEIIKKPIVGVVNKIGQSEKLTRDLYFETFVGRIYHTISYETKRKGILYSFVETINGQKSFGMGVNLGFSSFAIQFSGKDGVGIGFSLGSSSFGVGINRNGGFSVSMGQTVDSISGEYTFEFSPIAPLSFLALYYAVSCFPVYAPVLLPAI